MAEEKNKKIMIRFITVDLLETTALHIALSKIKGVSYNFSHAICATLKLDKNIPVKNIQEKEKEKIIDAIKNPTKYNIPAWLCNRRKDYETGIDKHLISADLKLQKEFDIKRLKMIKSYRGMRHQKGLPVRGQRTKGHFRKGTSLGVKRKK